MRRWQLALATAIACAGLGMGVVALGSPPKGGETYTGKTSQKRDVRLRVTLDGDLVRGFTIGRTFVCRKGLQRSSLSGRFRQERMRVRIGEAGGFHGEVKVRGVGGSRVRRGSVCLRGAFRRGGRVVRGRYREVLRLRDGSLCRTGLLRFVARVGS
jgi:hypothetical protein